MKEIMEKRNIRNNSIDIFRLICAIMVVAIHTHPFEGTNTTLAYFASDIFPRIAVPFFFCVSGYYYIGALLSNKKVFKSYMFKLLAIYTLWSIIYFIINFINAIYSGDFILSVLIKSTVMNYFINGSWFHLWFFPALFFAIIITTIFHKFKILKVLWWVSILLYILGCLGISYYSFENTIPLVSNLINGKHFTIIRRVVLMGLPFFMLGYFLNISKVKFINYSNKKLIFGVGAAIIFFLVEIFFVIKFNIQRSIIITLALYPLLAVTFMFFLKNPLPKISIIGYKSNLTANFMYYSHPISIILLNQFFKITLQINISSTLLFFFTCTLSIIASLIILRIDNKWLNKLVI